MNTRRKYTQEYQHCPLKHSLIFWKEKLSGPLKILLMIKAEKQTNKNRGVDKIQAELFKILQDDRAKVLFAVCKQAWKILNYIPVQKRESSA